VVVGHHEHRGAALVRDLPEQLHHDAAAHAVERGRGLVGEDERGLVGEGAGDGDALLLAAAEHLGVRALAARHVEVLEQLARAPPALVFAAELAGDLHVLAGVQEGGQVGLLEDEAQVAAAEEGEIGERAAVADDEAILEVDLAVSAGETKPRALIRVDLPAPLGPSSAATVPCASERLTSSRAFTAAVPPP
jgi:hypothetical protein